MFVAGAVVIGLAMLAGGCAAAKPGPGDPLGAVPTDLTLDVAVVSGGRAEAERGGEERVPAELRSSRFVLLPNGDLHYAPQRMGVRSGRPPLVRRLSRDELARVWSLCRETGLAEAKRMAMDQSPVPNPATGEVAYAIALQVGGEYRGVKRVHDRDEAPQSPEGTLVRELARLAWADEMPAERAMVMPKRYDFGPDPYERYRKP